MADSNTQVSQEAREAAADLMRELFEGYEPLKSDFEWAEVVRRGEDDDYPVVQAFQRAIDQSALAEREACAKVAEADNTPAYGVHNSAMEYLAETQRRNIATAIRERKV